MKASFQIRAGALQFVLFIGTVIAILLMTFVLVAYSHNYFHKRTDLVIDLVQEAHFGLLSPFGNFAPLNDSLISAPAQDRAVSISVHREFWGVFEKRHSSAAHGNLRFSKTALVGGCAKDGRSALYLEDRKRPLIIAGGAKITGNALLPEPGIRTGNISGNSYRYKQLVHGKIGTSDSKLPELHREVLSQIDGLYRREHWDNWEPVSLVPNLVQRNSFRSRTQLISGGTIYLDDVELIGNILISATHKIVVGPTANLRDVVLMAPEIVVQDGSKGCFQAIATKNIVVGKKCRLAYPSALVVMDRTKESGRENKEDGSGISVGTDTEIIGTVVYLDGSEGPRYAPQVRLSEGSLVIGEVYCQGSLELEGKVVGTVTTSAFVALKNGSIYQNHLYNGEINSSLLAPEYVGLFIGDVQHKGVMKWLY